MSRSETIQKLQALLDRVRMRSTGPLPRAAGAAPEPGFVEPPVDEPGPIAAASVAVDETGVSNEHDSRERLVAADVAAAEARPPALAIAPPRPESLPPIDVGEFEERAPASSRRPVAPEPEERLAQIAFGAEDPLPPLHTPPPESGRLPAAPDAQFDDQDYMGVRTATPLLPRRMEALPREIEPEAIRPHRIPSQAVGQILADATRFAPRTFVELLDASLSL
jgi:hypothetical protein